MGLNNSNKIISADRIDCSGSLKVTLALSASPDITENPTDIVLILDRSGSMAHQPLLFSPVVECLLRRVETADSVFGTHQDMPVRLGEYGVDVV